MSVRMKLTEVERQLVEAFRTERAIYNSALADAAKVLDSWRDNKISSEFEWDAVAAEILALRRVD